MPMCALFLFSRSGIAFNQSAGAITDHSQSAKDIDSYFKCQLCEELLFLLFQYCSVTPAIHFSDPQVAEINGPLTKNI